VTACTGTGTLSPTGCLDLSRSAGSAAAGGVAWLGPRRGERTAFPWLKNKDCDIIRKRTQGWTVVDKPKPDNRDEQAKTVGIAAGLGLSVVASLIILIGLGVFLDQRFDKAPLFTLIGVALGLFAAGYQLYELSQIGRKDRVGGPIARSIARGAQARKKQRTR